MPLITTKDLQQSLRPAQFRLPGRTEDLAALPLQTRRSCPWLGRACERGCVPGSACAEVQGGDDLTDYDVGYARDNASRRLREWQERLSQGQRH